MDRAIFQFAVGAASAMLGVAVYNYFDSQRIVQEAIHHVTSPPFVYAADHHTLHIRLRTKADNVKAVKLTHTDPYDKSTTETVEMTKSGSDGMFEFWFCSLVPPFRRSEYYFSIIGFDGSVLFFNEAGFHRSDIPPESGHFRFPFLCAPDVHLTPSWVKDTVWYQIFPERFANGNSLLNPPNTQPWGNSPDRNNFFGGDFQGIIDHIDHLVDLGVTGLYLTPIFLASSNHKYDTIDYLEIDPQFGDKKIFKEMVDLLHKNGIRIMLDCVFNHSGENFGPFVDVRKNQEYSRYKDWFFIREFPIKTHPKPNYDTFGFFGQMPKLNTSNPEVKEYLFKVARYWVTEFHIDGWRLDVANEIDHCFWREFCSIVRQANPDVFILGELWHNSTAWIGADQFDSTMNYPLTFACDNLFFTKTEKPLEFSKRISSILHWYPVTTNNVLFNLLSSHDIARALTRASGDVESFKMAYTFLLTYPGSPCIYYGDEIGMEGKEDPDCRRCMEWNPHKQNKIILQFLKKLIHLRKTYKQILCNGDFKFLETNDALRYLTYQRTSFQSDGGRGGDGGRGSASGSDSRGGSGNEAVIVVINLNKKKTALVRIPSNYVHGRDLFEEETDEGVGDTVGEAEEERGGLDARARKERGGGLGGEQQQLQVGAMSVKMFHFDIRSETKTIQ